MSELPPCIRGLSRRERQSFFDIEEPEVKSAAEAIWKNDQVLQGASFEGYVDRVLDIRQGCLLWLIGTVYLSLPLKPNVLEDLLNEQDLSVPVHRDKYIHEHSNCEIILEDNSGRVNLIGSKIREEPLVTGCVIAVLGSETTAGCFEVIDLCFAGLPCQPTLPMVDENRTYVAIVSGLSFGADMGDNCEVDLLKEYITGELGSANDRHSVAKICKLILAGNSTVSQTKMTDKTQLSKKYGYDSTKYNVKPTAALDDFLSQICSSIDVDLMAGEHDPSCAMLPQQPLHPSIFPKASVHIGSTLHPVTNPHTCEIHGKILLGTSGQNLRDAHRYVNNMGGLDMMTNFLHWRHLAPSSPDTLWCYPFQDKDPFIINETPHIFFSGGQKNFGTRLIKGEHGQLCRLIEVPTFSETPTIALVDLETLDCIPVNFSSWVTECEL